MRATVRVRSHAGDGDSDGPAAAGESDGEHTIPVLAAMPRDDERPDFQVLVRVQAPTDAALRAPIDVSGSMRCSPDTPDKPRDGDRLATVAFDHNVDGLKVQQHRFYFYRDLRRRQ
jgi:acetyl esterase/lipase